MKEIHNEVKKMLEAFGYNVSVTESSSHVYFSFPVKNGSESMPIRYKDAITMLAKGYLQEFYYMPGGTQEVILHQACLGLYPNEDRYSTLLREIRLVRTHEDDSEDKMEAFINMGDHFERYVGKNKTRKD